MFNEFDTNKNGVLNEDELYTMLVKLEIPTETRLVKPLLKKLDKSGNGVVEYDEFKNFLFFDPYHLWFDFINIPSLQLLPFMLVVVLYK